MGTSTSGVDEMETALRDYEKQGTPPRAASFLCQEIGSTADFVARAAGITGPAYCLSSACSSSAKVLASARGLIQTGLCDAVLVGGTDSLCELTLNGFASLEAISDVRTNPFSRFRRGINIGEGSAIFLMSREPVGPRLSGVGESSDAYHMASPDPSGAGASSAMRAALVDAQLLPGQIQYINLHGTGTTANDLMESRAVYAVFGDEVLCSSTKPLTGHTLGASGATEAALCWLTLSGKDRHVVVPHIFDGEPDPGLSAIRLCSSSASPLEIKHILSNSFAFGGNNVSVILSRNDHD
jgi:3-oxoacyl-[acyl-carrier-protein] synthase-1